MKYTYLIIIYILSVAILVFYILIKKQKVTPIQKIEHPELSKTDTIYHQIEKLQIKSDTLTIYYETKINSYRTLPTPERVHIFTERINR